MEVAERVRQYLPDGMNPMVIKYSSLPVGMDRPLRYCYMEYLHKDFPSKKTTYYQDMTRSIHYHPHLHQKTFLFYPHDRVEGFSVPTLVKSRPINDYGKSILFNLNYLRHFSDVYIIEKHDIPYEKKKDVLIWRGADTGYGFGNKIPYRPVSRQHLVEQYYHNNGNIDVGLSSVSANHTKDGQSIFEKYVKPRMTIKEMLQYKFILSVEGNDVATNLKWILNSNSVAFCPPFTLNSWILEENLQPWHHYIPVKHDFSDLSEKVEWAIHHSESCYEITQHAQQYIQQFMDIQKEKQIMDMILNEYAKNIKVME